MVYMIVSSVHLYSHSIIFAILFGISSASLGSSFAPNYAKARLSAKRIFALVDLVPSIDSYSEEGDKPVCCHVFQLMHMYTHYYYLVV